VAADISFSARPLPHPTPLNSPLRTRADSAVWLALGFIVIWSLFWVTVEIISFRVGVNRERKCADAFGTVPVPWAGHFQR